LAEVDNVLNRADEDRRHIEDLPRAGPVPAALTGEVVGRRLRIVGDYDYGGRAQLEAVEVMAGSLTQPLDLSCNIAGGPPGRIVGHDTICR